MATNGVIPDQVHIDKIREKLWCDREFGRAAVMVGAGFSRNADKVSPNARSFPTWGELAGTMFDGLYHPRDPSIRDRDTRRSIATSGANALRLASQYEAAFGAHALDSLIRTNIPDQQHRPDWLHRCLLELPWSDVFTTNYDTLLERTLPMVHDRKYDIILDHLDIPHAMRPRITKLHGSIDSKRPLIITEEHYRTYPTEFAPFVNMVQQAVMENLLCLIGFSGDDPNFLYWTGWVRDNLGRYSPPIYLIGLSRATPAEERLLHNRNVIPIDLSPVLSHANINDQQERYRIALAWFLENLRQGAPPDPTEWPEFSQQPPCISDQFLHKLPRPPSVGNLRKLPPLPDLRHTRLGKEQLLLLLNRWKEEREAYPNWIVCPRGIRWGVWFETQHRIYPILRSLDAVKEPQRLALVYELNWRLEIALTPVGAIAKEIAEVVRLFNPYPGLCDTDTEDPITPLREEWASADWDALGTFWVHLVFALSRTFREDFDEPSFKMWMNLVEGVASQSIHWEARWFYEESLFHLSKLDYRKLDATLQKWPDTKELPLWEARRAFLFSAADDFEESERIAEDALTDIRTRLRLSPADLFLMSLEGWLMLLLRAIKENRRPFVQELRKVYRNRWKKLQVYGCNPGPDLEQIDGELSAEMTGKAPKETKIGFDPGTRMSSYNMERSPREEQYRLGIRFLRMLEEGGVPPRVGIVGLAASTARNAAKAIQDTAPAKSVSIMVQAAGQEEIKGWLHRARVAVLDEPELRKSSEMLLGLFDQLLAQPSDLNTRKINVVAEALSRICFRFSEADRSRLFDLAVTLYTHPISRRDIRLYDCVRVIFRRLLFSMPQTEVLSHVSTLLSLPIPGDTNFKVVEPRHWNEPLSQIVWVEGSELPPDFDRSAWDLPIAQLIVMMKSGNAESRKRATLRLTQIYQLEGFSNSEAKEFELALWARIDPQSGLPADTGLYDYAFLDLPEPEPCRAKALLRTYLIGRDFPRITRKEMTPEGKESTSISGIDPSFEEFFQNLRQGTAGLLVMGPRERERLIDWDLNETQSLLDKATSWWNQEKGELRPKSASPGFSVPEILRERLAILVPLLGEVILPRVGPADQTVKDKALRLISEMNAAGFCVLSALPMTLFLDASNFDEVVRRVRQGLYSRREKEASGATNAILHWVGHSVSNNIQAPPPSLLNEVVYKVAARRRPGLFSAIDCVSAIVRHFPPMLIEGKIELGRLCEALDYLLGETAFPEVSDQIEADNTGLSITVEEIPEYRRVSAQLAFNVFRHLQSRSLEPSPVVEEWRRVGETDPLPEIRRIWGKL